MKLSEELIKVHPTFGMMGFYKEEKRRIYSYGLFAHLLLNGMLHPKAYLSSPASAKVTAPGCFTREELCEPPSKVHSYSSAP